MTKIPQYLKSKVWNKIIQARRSTIAPGGGLEIDDYYAVKVRIEEGEPECLKRAAEGPQPKTHNQMMIRGLVNQRCCG
jgi:hypothetical protein